MHEIHNIVSAAFDLLQSLGTHFVLPKAGVGGGMEVRESVEIRPILEFTAVFVASIAALFGVGLALAAKRFSVKVDPRVEHVKDVLAGAHCGACGYPGCEQYAEAVVSNPDVPPNLCTPGGARAAEVIAKITGKAPGETEPIFSRIMCQGGTGKSTRKFLYEGVRDCRAAVLAGGGDKTCMYGCLGYGTCARVCPFDAIHMGPDDLPIVDIAKCTGCRKCEVACPKNVIEVLPGSKAVLVSCHSKEKGGTVRKQCEVGCIACRKCEKICPFDAPTVENNLSRIDLEKCEVCGLCARVCPTTAIRDFMPTRPKAFITEKCIGCQRCAKVCPVDAASGEKKKLHVIDQEKCIGCGICTSKCPVQAIDGTFNAQAVFEAAAAKKAAREAAKAKEAAGAAEAA
ncbi:MAG: RnfABCDGE type electron transport complex subunit B [Nitrospirota bacterium]|jgi:electron transport complex protein RnfB